MPSSSCAIIAIWRMRSRSACANCRAWWPMPCCRHWTRLRRPKRLNDATPSTPILSEADQALIAAAHDVLARHYRPFWHTVAAAIRGRNGRIWTGLHLGATVGRLSICAEAVALGRALLEGDGKIDTVVA